MVDLAPLAVHEGRLLVHRKRRLLDTKRPSVLRAPLFVKRETLPVDQGRRPLESKTLLVEEGML